MHYIFGYGSLICGDSRSRTGVTANAYAIEVEGIARRWSAYIPSWSGTAVSAHLDPKSRCNGVYFAVDDENLALFDEREYGYRRVALPWQAVMPLDQTPLPRDGTLWVYVGNSVDIPSPEKPILQSYLDVIINGCLDIDESFARRFIELTGQWGHLVNDRDAPLYLRPLARKSSTARIDELLNKQLPAGVSDDYQGKPL
ncbi:gamma-glutamylcyclotransferase family protein [Reinekea thalattae]|uniref:Gamma-glutamylcyclotransferase n=1 Tax=Reinekea thalattae TaxID=2593301 RepID=A0A5C8Z9H6_9GAMM|nr:gamma-glutamylcyclotransferase family protein [Reinekea thalattae]TXR54034.1 gamma-glutamylcyclotransferase [Reinekea thalattae]